jgi:hypothetical protein
MLTKFHLSYFVLSFCLATRRCGTLVRVGRLLVILWSIFHSMETIQVVLDSELLEATNGAAKRARVNRSSLIREALREHIKRLRASEIEARDRQGYRRRPDAAGDAAAWERGASWPER